MTIKLTPLEKAFPGNYNTNRELSGMLINAGVDWLKLHYLIAENRDKTSWLMTVELPVMHQCLELLIKALATLVENKKKPKSMGHATIKIVEAYQSQIPEFAKIAADKAKRELIEGLEGSYFSVRYFETTIRYDRADAELFEEVALALVEEYHRLTKVPLLQHHFKGAPGVIPSSTAPAATATSGPTPAVVPRAGTGPTT